MRVRVSFIVVMTDEDMRALEGHFATKYATKREAASDLKQYVQDEGRGGLEEIVSHYNYLNRSETEGEDDEEQNMGVIGAFPAPPPRPIKGGAD